MNLCVSRQFREILACRIRKTGRGVTLKIWSLELFMTSTDVSLWSVDLTSAQCLIIRLFLYSILTLALNISICFIYYSDSFRHSFVQGCCFKVISARAECIGLVPIQFMIYESLLFRFNSFSIIGSSDSNNRKTSNKNSTFHHNLGKIDWNVNVAHQAPNNIPPLIHGTKGPP